MSVLIEHYFAHHSAVTMDMCARDHLAANAIPTSCTPSARGSGTDLSRFSLLLSRGNLPGELRDRVRCFGGRNLSRIENLDYARRSGLDQMEWATARTQDNVAALFDDWRTDTLLLKRSGTWKGRGLSLVTRSDLADLKWDSDRDLFCREVNRQDGSVAKVECLAGELIITWIWRIPPIRKLIVNGKIDQERLLRARRAPDGGLPEETLTRARDCSVLASGDGLGHISIDFMRSPDGRWRVIELNSQEVAVWWTSKFEAARRNYANAVYSLATKF